jgi:hypothetical protein
MKDESNTTEQKSGAHSYTESAEVEASVEEKEPTQEELLIDLFRVFFNVDKLFPVPEEMVIRTLCNFTIQRKKS